MDPLSIIASSVAVAHTLHVTLRGIQATRRALPELIALHNEVSDLRLVLQELEAILEQREQAANPLPPNAHLIQAINSSKGKLVQLSNEVLTWDLGHPLFSTVDDQKRFRLLRVGRKAQRYKEELKEIKANLTAHLSIHSTSTTSRIEIDLQQVLLVARAEAAKSDQSHETIKQQLTRHGEQLQTLARMTQSDQQDTNTSQSQASAVRGEYAPVNEVVSADKFDTEKVKAFQHNGSILFESSQLTAISAVGIRTAQFPRAACSPWCSCICHHERRFRTPQILENVIGSLFVGYSGLPKLTEPCDEHGCRLRAQPTSSITYFFPPWFLARALSLVLSSTPLAGPIATLKFQRAISGDADVFNFAKLGEVENMKRLFEDGLASPHDVHYESGLAISHRQIHVCKFLLQMNANPFLEDRTQWAAADNAWDKILSRSFPSPTEKALREMFSETECISRRDFTVLHKIILHLLPNDLDAVLAASTAEINAFDSNQRTAHSLAAERGDLPSLTTLFRYGADPAPASTSGSTALHFAACALDPCCLAPLIEHGAVIDARTNWDQTPLIYAAAYREDKRHAEILLRKGADAGVRDLDGINALGWTAIVGNVPVAKMILSSGGGADLIFAADNGGQTALTRCVSVNRYEILEAVIEKLKGDGLELVGDEQVLLAAAESADLRTLALLREFDFEALDVTSVVDGNGECVEGVLKRRADFDESLLAAFRGLWQRNDEQERDVWHDAFEHLGSEG
ncbi:uncharacterized protein KY384_005700 [Bacidia gigantensis]|uniref:uncharacterized protein n=1 Tax=Bacidia gigantensis TaxID=2732470 RepID=UPI001D036AAC|nr:uncharacterized protein KY384_005700 [Bacidia gigantensis]KAG8529065.1 hypothetical protein KY384_005700 [Bacidia gigantensis]